MPSYLITGSSRGLGLAFVTELAKNPANHIIATARNPFTAKGLTEIVNSSPAARIDLVQLDVTDPSSVTAAVSAVSKLLPNGLDALVSNAGADLQTMVPMEKLDLDKLDEELHFMVTGTLGLLRSYLPLIKKGEQKKILVISSVLGSIDRAAYMPGLADAYSISRAALNMLIRKWGGALKGEGVTTAVIHPGWVPSTELGSGIIDYMAKYAPQTPAVTTADSAAGVIKVLESLNIEETGTFFNYDGTKLLW